MFFVSKARNAALFGFLSFVQFPFPIGTFMCSLRKKKKVYKSHVKSMSRNEIKKF